MDEIAELRDALDRLHAALEDLAVRGLRAAGAADLTRLTALRDEFRTAGAGHLADRLTALVDRVHAALQRLCIVLLRCDVRFVGCYRHGLPSRRRRFLGARSRR